MGLIEVGLSDIDRGLAAFEQAYVLNPNDPDMLAIYGQQLPLVGRAKEGAEMIDRAFRLNPHYPDWYNLNPDPYYATGQYDRAVTMSRRFSGELPIWNLAIMAMSYAQLRQKKEATMAMAELSRRFPDPSFERFLSEFGTIRDEPALAHYLDGWRKAGLRDCATPEKLQKYPKMTHLAVCDAKRATN